MIRVFIAIGLVVLFLIVGLPACGILFLLKKKDPVGAAEKAQALAAGVLKGITGLIGIRYETIGLENVPKEGGLLTARWALSPRTGCGKLCPSAAGCSW